MGKSCATSSGGKVIGVVISTMRIATLSCNPGTAWAKMSSVMLVLACPSLRETESTSMPLVRYWRIPRVVYLLEERLYKMT